MASRAAWCFMVYLAGDNNLCTAGGVDLAEMRSAGSTPDVHVVAQFDNAWNAGTTRFRVLAGGAGEQVENLGPTDSGDPNVLLSFVRWAVETYPAERHALILWNHGGGWEPSDIDQIAAEVKAPQYTAREGTQRAATSLARTFFRPALAAILSRPTPHERMICSDDGSGHSLDTIELGRVLSVIHGLLGKRLDLLGMDACLMSSLEVAYQVRNHVRTIVGSEETEPNSGWPYERILGQLVARPGMGAAALARHIVEAYAASYAQAGYSGRITQSAFVTARLAAFARLLDTLSAAILEEMQESPDAVWLAVRRAARFYQGTLYDIGHFSQTLAENALHVEVRTAAAQVVDALAEGCGPVLASKASGPGLEACRGLSIYLPALKEVSPFYAGLDFAGKHQWPRVLEAIAKL